MKRYYKLTVALVMLGLLVVSFQNCGKPSSNYNDSKDVFVHFNELQNTEYEIVTSNCSTDVCLFTLHSLDNVNEPIGTKARDGLPETNEMNIPSKKQTNPGITVVNQRTSDTDPSVEYDFQPNRSASSIDLEQEVEPSGIYCDVLQQSGFGDVYVSCPQEVQNDAGFYIRL